MDNDIAQMGITNTVGTRILSDVVYARLPTKVGHANINKDCIKYNPFIYRLYTVSSVKMICSVIINVSNTLRPSYIVA